MVNNNKDNRTMDDEKRRKEALSTLQEGDIVKGTVLSLRNFGVFVDLGGVEGLVRIYELTPHPIQHPRDMFQVGDEIDVKILHIDYEGLRVSLSHKATLPNV